MKIDDFIFVQKSGHVSFLKKKKAACSNFLAYCNHSR